MNIARLDSSSADFDARLEGLLAFENTQDASIDAAVASILEDVRRRGDAAVLEQDILPGDAQIGAPVLDVGRDIGGTDHDDAHVGPTGADDELARGFRVLGRHDARGGQQRRGFLEDAPLREGDGDAVHGRQSGKRAKIVPD